MVMNDDASTSLHSHMLTGPDEGEYDNDDAYDDDDRRSASSVESAFALTSSAHDQDEAQMDWGRSRRLQQAILDDLRHGRRPQLPALKFVLDGLFGRV